MTNNEQYDYNGDTSLPIVVDPVQPPLQEVKKKLYRDTDDVMIGGVCSGLAYRFHLSVMLVRALTVIGGFFAIYIVALAYLVIWLVVPKAITVAQKLEMHGLPPDPQVIQRFKSYKVQHGCLYSGISVVFKICLFLSLIISAYLLFRHFWPE